MILSLSISVTGMANEANLAPIVDDGPTCNEVLDKCVKVHEASKKKINNQEEEIKKQEEIIKLQEDRVEELEKKANVSIITAIGSNLIWLLLILL